MKIVIQHIMLVILFSVFSGCSNLPRKPVPLDQIHRAEVPGLPGIRAWSGQFSEHFETDLLQSVQQLSIHNTTTSIETPFTNVLSISGGSDYGAFGAGFMNGWSKSGLRPEFKIVTGISTGALIAPFALLGQEYDRTLKLAYTTVSPKDIYNPRWFSFIWNDAFADSEPLSRLIAKYITKDVLEAIAEAYRQGRRLYVGTTYLDADQLIVWNMGAIANSGHPQALDLFHQIILASSAIPAAFPPVFIEVEIDGVYYDEMHVDGGIKAQLFLLAATLDLAKFMGELEKVEKADRIRRVFVIRNGEITPKPRQISRSIADISTRSMASLIKSQAQNDLNRIYEITKQQRLDFNWVALPAEYDSTGTKKFSTDKMNKLFNLGYEMGKNNKSWNKVPPGLGKP